MLRTFTLWPYATNSASHTVCDAQLPFPPSFPPGLSGSYAAVAPISISLYFFYINLRREEDSSGYLAHDTLLLILTQILVALLLHSFLQNHEKSLPRIVVFLCEYLLARAGRLPGDRVTAELRDMAYGPLDQDMFVEFHLGG